MGLGLAIVEHLVEMHGGTIAAASEGEGRGSTFTVQIPISAVHSENAGGEEGDVSHAAAPADLNSASAVFSAPVSLHGIRVLVVDDDAAARTVLKRVLARSGAMVSDAADVESALALLSAFGPHILISDVGIPQQDGYDLIRAVRLRGHTPEKLPAIALTAFARKEDRSQSMLAGFQLHLSKPVDAGELLSAVSTPGR